MRFFLISDNNDTRLGTCPFCHKVLAFMEQEDIAVILMTEQLVKLCGPLVDDLKLHRARPLIVEIPDRHGGGRAKDSITRYVREAIGIKI